MKQLQLSKVLACILLCAVILLGVFPGQVLATEDPAATLEIDGDGYYLIATADDLYAFAALVNSGETNINGKLTEDIVVNEGTMTSTSTNARVWTPIGTSAKPYTGTFEGNNKTISGLYYSTSGATYIGLFGATGTGAVIRKVTVANSYLKASRYVGGIAGANDGGTIQNCVIADTNYFASSNDMGGIVGTNKNGGIIQNCVNNAELYGGYYVGGIVGSNNATVQDSHNHGKLAGSMSVGGIVGSNSGGLVSGCSNSANVSTKGNQVELYGGVIGSLSAGTAMNCMNSGTIGGGTNYSIKYVGGIAGKNSGGKLLNCCNIGTAKYCQYSGGICGYTISYSGTAANNYSSGENGITANDFTSGKVAYLLSQGCTQNNIFYSGEVWGQNLDTDAAPSLGGATVYQLTDCQGNISYSNTNQEAGFHTYEYGSCIRCGEPAGPFDISFTSMILGNSLGIHFAFEQDHRADWTGCYAEITKSCAGSEDVTLTVPFEHWATTLTRQGASFYVGFYGIAAKEMTDMLYVTLYDAEGNAISNVYEDSVESYALRVLDKAESTDALKTMIVDMLNYGAAAQEYFDYNTPDLANGELTEAQQALATQTTAYEDGRVKGANYMGTRLILESNISMEFAFRNLNADMTAEISYTDHYGDEIILETQPEAVGSSWIVVLEELVVADGRQEITVKVYDGETVVAEAIDSMESYVARMNSSAPLYEQLMKFSDSAYTYFRTIE